VVSATLPAWITAALRGRADGASGRGLATAAGEISLRYRAAERSATTIASERDALAYGLSRMPATYSAVAAVLDELQARAPTFVPASMFDAGAGPGTATWAALEAWPEVGRAVLVDHNPHLLALAGHLAEAGGAGAAATLVAGELGRLAPENGPFDLVVAAYALTELPDAALAETALSLWQACSGALVIVEPGRPREHGRLLLVRDALIGQGAQVVAPCPHAGACPLVAPDWCHFSVRLPRSREHMRMKGGTLGYEDEKFSYLIVARPEIAVRGAAARVIKPPHQTKAGVELALCTPAGVEARSVMARDRAALKAARRLRWGDAAG
jgi:ribosomal protein RSM22 (predicted rRNA methylase)